MNREKDEGPDVFRITRFPAVNLEHSEVLVHGSQARAMIAERLGTVPWGRGRRRAGLDDFLTVRIKQERLGRAIAQEPGDLAAFEQEARRGSRGSILRVPRRLPDGLRDPICEPMEEALVKPRGGRTPLVVDLVGEEVSGSMVNVRRGENQVLRRQAQAVVAQKPSHPRMQSARNRVEIAGDEGSALSRGIAEEKGAGTQACPITTSEPGGDAAASHREPRRRSDVDAMGSGRQSFALLGRRDLVRRDSDERVPEKPDTVEPVFQANQEVQETLAGLSDHGSSSNLPGASISANPAGFWIP